MIMQALPTWFANEPKQTEFVATNVGCHCDSINAQVGTGHHLL